MNMFLMTKATTGGADISSWRMSGDTLLPKTFFNDTPEEVSRHTIGLPINAALIATDTEIKTCSVVAALDLGIPLERLPRDILEVSRVVNALRFLEESDVRNFRKWSEKERVGCVMTLCQLDKFASRSGFTKLNSGDLVDTNERGVEMNRLLRLHPFVNEHVAYKLLSASVMNPLDSFERGKTFSADYLSSVLLGYAITFYDILGLMSTMSPEHIEQLSAQTTLDGTMSVLLELHTAITTQAMGELRTLDTDVGLSAFGALFEPGMRPVYQAIKVVRSMCVSPRPQTLLTLHALLSITAATPDDLGIQVTDTSPLSGLRQKIDGVFTRLIITWLEWLAPECVETPEQRAYVIAQLKTLLRT